MLALVGSGRRSGLHSFVVVRSWQILLVGGAESLRLALAGMKACVERDCGDDFATALKYRFDGALAGLSIRASAGSDVIDGPSTRSLRKFSCSALVDG